MDEFQEALRPVLGDAVVDAADLSLPLALQALASARERKDPAGTALALSVLAVASLRSGALEGAASLSEECVTLLEAAGDRLGAARSRLLLGVIASRRGRRADALDLFARAREAFEALGSRDEEALALGDMARVQLAAGKLDEAARLSARAQAVFRATGNRKGLCGALDCAGEAARRLGDREAAVAAYREAAAIALDLGAVVLALILTVDFAALRLSGRDAEGAAEALGLVLAHAACDVEARQRAVELLGELQEALPARKLEAAMARGRERGGDWADALRRELERAA